MSVESFACARYSQVERVADELANAIRGTSLHGELLTGDRPLILLKDATLFKPCEACAYM
jgi:hypothetical protein